jgi:putative SOS response-associated peptidase YedK
VALGSAREYEAVMCGRYNITSAPEQVRALFRYPEQPNFPPRYNVAPTQPIPIVRMTDGGRHFALVRWGLIPPWVKDPRTFSLLINARAESVNEKPAFKNAMKRRRCLIPADGFYEWKSEGGSKRPFVARPNGGSLMAFAGLWETWTGPNGEELETAAIITTEANKEMGAVHHRAPVIVPPEQFDFWLDCANVNEQEAASLFVPAPDGSMEVYEISTAVNRVANDAPQLLERYDSGAAPAEPAAEKPKTARKPRPAADSGQGSLF